MTGKYHCTSDLRDLTTRGSVEGVGVGVEVEGEGGGGGGVAGGSRCNTRKNAFRPCPNGRLQLDTCGCFVHALRLYFSHGIFPGH